MGYVSRKNTGGGALLTDAPMEFLKTHTDYTWVGPMAQRRRL